MVLPFSGHGKNEQQIMMSLSGYSPDTLFTNLLQKVGRYVSEGIDRQSEEVGGTRGLGIG